jgi:AraC-like DNA-binding protein
LHFWRIGGTMFRMKSAPAGRRFELISVIHPRHRAGVQTPGLPCVNHDLHLIQILRGAGTLRFGEACWTIQPGRAFLVPPLTPYTFAKHPGQPLEMVNFHFHLDLEGGVPLLAARSMPGSFPMARPTQAARRLRRLARRWRGGDAMARMVVSGEALCLIADYIHRHSTPRPRPSLQDESIVQLRHWIDRNAAGPCDRRSLAGIAHLSVSQMNRRFRAVYGRSPRSVYDQRRLARIQEQLRNTVLPMGELADQFGFRDPFYFCRWFGKQCGVAPTAYRRRSRLVQL